MMALGSELIRSMINTHIPSMGVQQQTKPNQTKPNQTKPNTNWSQRCVHRHEMGSLIRKQIPRPWPPAVLTPQAPRVSGPQAENIASVTGQIFVMVKRMNCISSAKQFSLVSQKNR